METLTVEKVKSKNLDVVKEYEKSNMKQMANFVVIGMSYVPFALCLIDSDRSRGSWQKHADGPSPV